MADFDFSQLQGLLSQFQPTEQDRQAAQKAMIMQLGMSLLGTRKGQEWDRLGYAMQNGAAARDAAMSGFGKQRMENMQSASAAMNLMNQGQAFEDDRTARRITSEYAQGGEEVPPNVVQAGGGGTGAAQGGGSSKRNQFEYWSGLAQKFAAGGLNKQADAAMAQAEKFRPKFKEDKVYTQGGKRIVVRSYDDGTSEVLPYGPDQEKAHFLDTGATVGAVDPFTGQPVAGGGLYNKQMTPGETASNALGLKNYGLSAAHLKLAQDKANQEKSEAYGTPIQITTPDGATQLMIPRKGTNQVVPMTDAQGNPVTKSASIPQKYKDTLYNLNNLESQLNSYNKELAQFSTGTYFSPEAATRLVSKYASLKMDLKNLYELGALAGPDVSILAEGLTDPASIKGMVLPRSHFEAQTKIIKDRLSASRANLSKAYNQQATGANDPLGLR